MRTGAAKTLLRPVGGWHFDRHRKLVMSAARLVRITNREQSTHICKSLCVAKEIHSQGTIEAIAISSNIVKAQLRPRDTHVGNAATSHVAFGMFAKLHVAIAVNDRFDVTVDHDPLVPQSHHTNC